MPTAEKQPAPISDDRASRLTVSKKLLFSLIAIVAVFGSIELLFRGLEQSRPPRVADHDLGFDRNSRVFVESKDSPGRMETHPAKRISFPTQHFYQPKPPRTFRIVVLGGSSVHYLQPELQLLATELTREFQAVLDKVEIINGGGFAYGSHRLVLVFRELLRYDPDLVLIYSGHNEFEEVEQLQLASLNRTGVVRSLSKSAFVRFIRDRKIDHDIHRLEQQHNQRVLAQAEPVSDSNFARAWNHPFTRAGVVERMQRYEIASVLEHKKTTPANARAWLAWTVGETEAIDSIVPRSSRRLLAYRGHPTNRRGFAIPVANWIRFV